jgi:hypothetical protein
MKSRAAVREPVAILHHEVHVMLGRRMGLCLFQV